MSNLVSKPAEKRLCCNSTANLHRGLRAVNTMQRAFSMKMFVNRSTGNKVFYVFRG